jgi:hypothetical protein
MRLLVRLGFRLMVFSTMVRHAAVTSDSSVLEPRRMSNFAHFIQMHAPWYIDADLIAGPRRHPVHLVQLPRVLHRCSDLVQGSLLR